MLPTKSHYRSMLQSKICINIWATHTSGKRITQKSQRVSQSVWEVDNTAEDSHTLKLLKNLIWVQSSISEAYFSQEVWETFSRKPWTFRIHTQETFWETSCQTLFCMRTKCTFTLQKVPKRKKDQPMLWRYPLLWFH